MAKSATMYEKMREKQREETFKKAEREYLKQQNKKGKLSAKDR